MKEALERFFGSSYQTTIAAIASAIGLVPQAIESLGLETTPQWLRITGMVCAFVSFIYMGVKAKSVNDTE